MKWTVALLNLIGTKRKVRSSMGFALIATLGLSGCAWDHEQPEVCFDSEVLPIFVSYCSTSGCHNPTDRTEGYDFTNYEGIMRGVRANRANDSKIYEALTEEESEDDHMPPIGQPQPSDAQITLIKTWINIGSENTQNCGSMACDTAATVSFSADIQSMVQTYCVGCHGGGAPEAGLNLSDHATFKLNAENGRIQGAMSGDPNYTPMPLNSALLSPCYVAMIEKWVAAGAPNN